MLKTIRESAAVLLLVVLGASTARAATNVTVICQEPGGKPLLQIDGRQILRESDKKTVLYVDGQDILPGPRADKILVVDDHDVRKTSAGVKLAVFDGNDIRHGTGGKVVMNYQHPNLCPTGKENRVYSVDGPPLTKAQLVAVLYVLKPGIFDLTNDEIAAQQKAMKEAAAEQDRIDAADGVAGEWDLLNGRGPVEKVGGGTVTVAAKKGDAYPVTFDHTKGGGPLWTGVGVYKESPGRKNFWVAYGTPKTVALCVYEIKGGSLAGKWYPWYGDGDAKNVGTENLTGPEGLDGEYKIVSAKAPATGAAYTGTVTIKPAKIVGAAEGAMPYHLTWTLGATKLNGIGIRTGDFLFVSSGTGADVNVAKFKVETGVMTSDWFKLGSDEMGGTALSK